MKTVLLSSFCFQAVGYALQLVALLTRHSREGLHVLGIGISMFGIGIFVGGVIELFSNPRRKQSSGGKLS